jgi:hypothetical protein
LALKRGRKARKIVEKEEEMKKKWKIRILVGMLCDIKLLYGVY